MPKYKTVFINFVIMILAISCIFSLTSCNGCGKIDDKISKVDDKIEYHVSKFHYCGDGLQKDTVCDDGSIMHIVRSPEEMREYFLLYKKSFPFDGSTNESPEFDEWIYKFQREYPEEFFKDNVLVFAYIYASSGGDVYVVSNVTLSDGKLCVEFTQTEKGFTNDMGAWLAWIPLSKAEIEGCVDFQVVKNKLK